MNYENQPCPCCGAHFREGDDIVVCPVCGTPQHRSCWTENGQCINETKHAEGFRWAAGGESAETANNTGAPDESRNTQVIICRICGSENPADFTHCGHCGAPVNAGEAEPSTTVCIYCGSENSSENTRCKNCGAPLTPYVRQRENPFIAATGMDENEIIGHHTAGELALYVRSSAKKYLEKFKRFENGRKLSFNWAGFFLGYVWLFSRKLYKYGLLVILLLATAVLVASASPGMQKANELLTPYAEQYYSGNISPEEVAKVMPEVMEAIRIPSLIMSLSVLALNLFCALAGDRLYYSKVKRDLDDFTNTVPDRDLQAMMISRKGGMSVLSGICGYFAYTFTVGVLSRIADFIASKM